MTIPIPIPAEYDDTDTDTDDGRDANHNANFWQKSLGSTWLASYAANTCVTFIS